MNLKISRKAAKVIRTLGSDCCPFCCNRDFLYWHSVEVEGLEAWQRATCHTCERDFYLVFKFHHVEVDVEEVAGETP